MSKWYRVETDDTCNPFVSDFIIPPKVGQPYRYHGEITKAEEVEIRPLHQPECKWELDYCVPPSFHTEGISNLGWLKQEGRNYCPECGRRL